METYAATAQRRLSLWDKPALPPVEGEDPLGDRFIASRTAEARRATGTVYTPPEIVTAMTAWARRNATPSRVVDPGAGSGRFLLAAGRAFPDAELVGVEIDPAAAEVLRANIDACGLASRARVLVGDYRQTEIPPIEGQTLFIGNPPYVRHHDIGPEGKAWFIRTAAHYGERASGLAGLHLYFFLRTLQLAQPGDVGAFVTSSEWLDVNYGSVLRNLLARDLGGTALHMIDPRAMPFPGTNTTGAITIFNVGCRPEELRVRSVETLSELGDLSAGEAVPWVEVARNKRWSTIVRPVARPTGEFIELGELCRVHRGTVTGANDVFIAGHAPAGLAERFLVPSVTKARELIAAVDVLRDADRLRRVIDIPADLSDVAPEDLPAVERFLEWARGRGADRSYTARHRRAWWEVRLQAPAPIICTYMARRPPAFVRNLCEARHINIAHGIYPREPLGEHAMEALLTHLRTTVTTASGRTYAGGLTKFEPRELERVHIPTLEALRAV